MPKTVNKLTAKYIEHKKEPGWYPDGNGLYLQISSTGSKSWVYRYQIKGKERRHGLGSFNSTNSLDRARKEAEFCGQLRKDGIDPIDYKNEISLKNDLAKAKSITFKECAIAYIESHKHGWKNKKHESQWRNTMETYAYPVIGNLPVQSVDIDLIMKIIEPIWYDKTETASRIRQRIENILDWATVRKFRTGDNPALWRGRIDKLLPKRNKVQKPKHFAAMDYRDLPEYFQTVRKKDTIASKALAFTILTATRNGEARAATRSEIDDKATAWVIPDNRMKADREHRVPLSKEALAVIKEVDPFKKVADDFLFPGNVKGKPINEAALMKLLKQTHPTLTIHGFRSTFRDWCAEQTSYPREVAEAALAHTLKDKTEAAYQRGDMFDKRRKLMESWADYCLNGKGNAEVVPINKAAN
jgi:integrase